MTEGNGRREPATPQEIWEILRDVSATQQETARRMQETDQLLKRQAQEADRRAQEADRRAQEADRRAQEADRRAQETDRRAQETDRRLQETDRRIRGLDELFNGQWGKLMEALVEGDLVRLLQQRNIAVHHTVTNPRQNYGERRWEFDIVAINGEEVVVVEVKTTLRVPDVDRFIGRLHEFPELMPEYAGHRIYGAVAYLKAYQESDVRAERLGLFVIRATGSSASITNRQEFTPRTFGPRSTAPGRR